jgi:isoleucyl-tRNA synthetase
MKDYKDTINLPSTDFPMKGNLPNREPEILSRWNQIHLYQKLRQQAKNKTFILHDGPPYANGNIHLGHAVNKVLKDIVIKSRTLSGYDAPYVPGWDCHGLPIEHKIELKYGKAGEKISAKEFRQKCRDYAREQMQIQIAEFKRLGVVGDWDNPYYTMSPDYEANILRSFAKMIANGHLQRGRKPVHWCIDCGSALAEAEVEYKEKRSPAIDVHFTVVNPQSLFAATQHNPHYQLSGNKKMSVPIWTTTPWTLPANEAVALHPDLNYLLLETTDKYFLIAESLTNSVMNRYEVQEYKIIANATGAQLEGIKLQHPFYNKEVPLVLGQHVTTEDGTGAVHTAPAHGQDDYSVAQKYNLPITSPLDDSGRFKSDIEFFANKHVTKVNNGVIDILKAKGNLIHEEIINHSYPHCWRHKTPLIFRATAQWFISMDKKALRRDALEAIFTVQWLPESGQARLATMITNRPDWCISRQRTWGVPLSLFVHKETDEIHPQMVSLLEKIAERFETDGIEAWYDLNPEEFLGIDATHYQKNNDILDVWYDAGVSHQCVLQKNPQLHFPADLYLEGSDQHRGWFQSSLLTSVGICHEAPFKTILTHGFTVDAHGHKMSKSLGNVVAPEKIINTLGADILRLWVASTDYRAEMSVSDEILKRISDTYRRIRNTARYLLSNLNDFDPIKNTVPTHQLLALDRFMIDRARLLQAQIIEAYEHYQFHTIYQKIHHFCAIDLGAFYLDIIKDRQYTTQKNSLARRSAQTAMYKIIESLVRLIAPILSFTAEEIWRYIPGVHDESIFLTTWYDDLPALAKDEPLNASFWEMVMKIRDAVNKELEKNRAEGLIGAPLDAAVTLYCAPDLEQQLKTIESELRFIFITSHAKVLAENLATHAFSTEIPGLKIKIEAVSDAKCIRCWHKSADVGANKNHPEICLRCVSNVEGEGELRQFA